MPRVHRGSHLADQTLPLDHPGLGTTDRYVGNDSSALLLVNHFRAGAVGEGATRAPRSRGVSGAMDIVGSASYSLLIRIPNCVVLVGHPCKLA